MAEAATEVGPPLFFSLLIITLSFLPVFTLEAQEGRLFAPLAFTKTYAMAAAAGLSITLVPVLMGYFIRGTDYAGAQEPDQPVLDRRLPAAYHAVMRSRSDPGRVRLRSSVVGLWPRPSWARSSCRRWTRAT